MSEEKEKSTALEKLNSEGIERILEEEKLMELLEGKRHVRLQKFQRYLHINPKEHTVLQTCIKVNKIHKNEYIPISFIEMLLDQIFFGDWGAEIVSEKQVLNEYVVSITLWYTHPVTGNRITRPGIGATPIQQDKGALPSDLDAKKTRALEKDAPHALANAIKNAAQKIGRIFGRDLGREDASQGYSPFISEEKESGLNKKLDDIFDGVGKEKSTDGKKTE